MSRRILVFGATHDLSRSIGRVLEAVGDRVEGAERLRDLTDRLTSGSYDALLSVAAQTKGDHGIEACEAAIQAAPDVPVVVIAADASAPTLLQAIRAGATDALIAPYQPGQLLSVLERVIARARDRQTARRLSTEAVPTGGFDGLVGDGVAMRKIFSILERSGPSDVSALFVGERGTGRETLARALHQRSRRRAEPFVVVPGSTSPTDPTRFVAHAKGGTLFLSGADRWSGSIVALVEAARESNVRLMASIEPASSPAWADQTPFGQALRFELPPLRQRDDDIAVMARLLIDRFAALTGKRIHGVMPEVVERLRSHGWPGNIDELSAVIETSVAHAAYDRITVDDLPAPVRARAPLPAGRRPVETMDEVERTHILAVLDSVGHNKTFAARLLGLDRKTLYRKLERYEAEGRLPQRHPPEQAA